MAMADDPDDDSSLAEKIVASGKVVVKDLAMSDDTTPGNPFSRLDTETGERKYCSESLFNSADEQYVIPPGRSEPEQLKHCTECDNDTWRTDTDECGMCGVPMFNCPKCDSELCGQKESCPECGVQYRWD